jgi:nitrate reductase assembly molybdenum cofactor insertion protein NarJ
MEKLLELFAGMLEYPQPGLAGLAWECERRAECPEAAGALREFRMFVEGSPSAQLEEAYTAAFDLSAESCPYAGYHLFGDGHKRSAFLSELAARYRARGLETGSELPDHLSALLRFAAACGQGEEREEILREAVLPALQRMTPPAGPGYAAVLRALAATLAGG